MRILLFLVLLSPLAAAGAYHAALNLSGEVAILYYYDLDGREFMTPVWVMRERGDLFVRATDPHRRWLELVRARPEVSIERADGRQSYRAVIEPHRRDLVNQLALQDHGWGEMLLSRLEDRSQAVPVRLAAR